MVLDSDFKLVHGASCWRAAVLCAKEYGSTIPDEPPAVCVAVRWVPRVYGAAHGFCGDYFAASVGAIDTTAGLVIFEWMVARPDLPLRVRHKAIEHLMRAGMVYATAIGKRIVTLNTPIGVRKLAERIGFARVNKDLEVLEGEIE